MNHTPEPWINLAQGVVITDDVGHHIAELEPSQETRLSATTQRANGLRIVACVNACAGINPNAVPKMMESLRLIAAWEPTESHDEPHGMSIMDAIYLAQQAIAESKQL
jgi:hypothetical protein